MHEYNSAKDHVFQTLNDDWWEENEDTISQNIGIEGSEEFYSYSTASGKELLFGLTHCLSGTEEQEIEILTAVKLMTDADWEKFTWHFQYDADTHATKALLENLKNNPYELEKPLWNTKIETEEQLEELDQMFRTASWDWCYIVENMLYIFHKIKPPWAENAEYYKNTPECNGKAFLYEP